jgi:protein TonB
MNPQTKATHVSLLLHIALFTCVFVGSRQIAPINPPIALDLAILTTGSSSSRLDAAPRQPAKTSIPSARPKERGKIAPDKRKTAGPKTTPPPRSLPQETPQPVPAPQQQVESAPAASATPATAAPASGSAAPGQAASPAAPEQGGGGGGPASSGGIFTAGQLDGPLTVLAKTPPIYPAAARRQNIEGWIRVKFVVNEQGEVGQVDIVAAEPHGIFDQSVLRSLGNWRFKPGTIGGRVVKALVEQTITFKLQ